METSLQIRIDWSDLDLFGHVNNVAFFRYMQASRLHFCEKIGLTSLNEKSKLSFLVAASHCDFRKPLYYPGNVQVTTRNGEVRNTSFSLIHILTDENGETAAVGEDVLVLYDYHRQKKVVVDESLKNRMR